MKIRRDNRGLYITNPRGSVYRPGGVPGFSHAYEMGDGGLVEGDNPKATHVNQAPLVRIRLGDGTILHWAEEALHSEIDQRTTTDMNRTPQENAADLQAEQDNAARIPERHAVALERVGYRLTNRLTADSVDPDLAGPEF